MSETIAVIGCGMLGSTLARAFADKGADVAVWNRTPDKARQLEGPNLRVAESLQDAVREAELVLVSLSTYAAAEEALDPVEDWTDTTLVNVITGTPADAERFGAWAEERGARYLDGAVLCYPESIATDDGLIVYAGRPATWAAHEARLMQLGGASHFVSDVFGAANVVDVAVVGGFYNVAIGAFIEAAAYARACNVPIEALRADAENLLGLLRHSIDEAIEVINSGNYETDQATVDVILAANRSWRQAMVDAGQRAVLLSGQLQNYETAAAAGKGDLGPYVLFETAKASGPAG